MKKEKTKLNNYLAKPTKKREKKSYRIFPPAEISFLAQEDEKMTSDDYTYKYKYIYTYTYK